MVYFPWHTFTFSYINLKRKCLGLHRKAFRKVPFLVADEPLVVEEPLQGCHGAPGRRGAHDSRSVSPSADGSPVGASKENETPSH